MTQTRLPSSVCAWLDIHLPVAAPVQIFTGRWGLLYRLWALYCVASVISNNGILAHTLLKHWKETDFGFVHRRSELPQFAHRALPKPLHIVCCPFMNSQCCHLSRHWSKQTVQSRASTFSPRDQTSSLNWGVDVFGQETQVFYHPEYLIVPVCSKPGPHPSPFRWCHNWPQFRLAINWKSSVFHCSQLFWQRSWTLLRFRQGFCSPDGWHLCSHCWQYKRAEQVYFCCRIHFIGISKNGTRDNTD